MNENIPKLRFPEFKDEKGEEFSEWVRVKASKIFSVLRGEGLPKVLLVQDGCYQAIHYGQLFTDYKEIIKTIKSRTNYKGKRMSQYGDILMPSSDVTPLGLAKASAILVNSVVLGSDMNILRPRIKNINSIFFSYQLNFNKTSIIRLVSGTTVKHIYPSDIKSLTLLLPTLPEQTKIANFLSAVDKRIELLSNKVSQLEEYKKGAMQKLFSQEVRFKDENGEEFPEWEQTKINTLFSYANGKSNEQYVTDAGKYNLITLNSIDINGNLKTFHQKVNETDYSLIKNDLVMALSDVAHGFFLGLVDIIPNNNYVLNQRMGRLRLYKAKDADIRFLRTIINYNQPYFRKMGQGSSQQNLSKGDILKFNFLNPSLPEQTKIANFLSSLDSKIELATKELDKTEEYKKGLLQQMFI